LPANLANVIKGAKSLVNFDFVDEILNLAEQILSF
jgi:hypothetical protein